MPLTLDQAATAVATDAITNAREAAAPVPTVSGTLSLIQFPSRFNMEQLRTNAPWAHEVLPHTRQPTHLLTEEAVIRAARWALSSVPNPELVQDFNVNREDNVWAVDVGDVRMLQISESGVAVSFSRHIPQAQLQSLVDAACCQGGEPLDFVRATDAHVDAVLDRMCVRTGSIPVTRSHLQVHGRSYLLSFPGTKRWVLHVSSDGPNVHPWDGAHLGCRYDAAIPMNIAAFGRDDAFAASCLRAWGDRRYRDAAQRAPTTRPRARRLQWLDGFAIKMHPVAELIKHFAEEHSTAFLLQQDASTMLGDLSYRFTALASRLRFTSYPNPFC